ncbi:hypothetical protein PENSUB_9429 [Penicillium subrubescens]|uniref:Uncharacterized protein n=1 Tax=Penicillium subrubescens TaxID=1316194 RepID=A0A1Q5TDM4_9EURO|nr:hypothetical protein PENSUB_9429 [Penicillium subrubescens]
MAMKPLRSVTLARRIWEWHAEGMAAKNSIPGGGDPKIERSVTPEGQGLGRGTS